ncbi:uncharacterized protein LOC108879166 [Lates calcarifer]|uniref:Uncharacterized protein LOC108879166 n=1 Tax=Lates calcarifer TaxID=8187 RepID=A0AAJ7LMT1_LATCA|nr:uncharacterized protein LOC108879166 [Lates calcarifer]
MNNRRGCSASKQKYVLCKMPPDWATLNVRLGLQPPPPRDSIAVYTRNGQDLIYEGYICPNAPINLSMSELQPPLKQPRPLSYSQKYAILLEKIRAEEAEAKAEAQARNISEDQRKIEAVSAASSKPEQDAVKAEPSSTTQWHEDTADESKQQIKAAAALTSESDFMTDYPFPYEILDRGESFLPELGETEDLAYYFIPWETSNDIDIWNYLLSQ